ncbi:MAG TPA: hypothetical protein VIY49_09275 [Bryobacteraceae bacterium]
MKRLMSTMACAALALSLCFGASANASIPVSMAPAALALNAAAPDYRILYIVVVIYVSDLGDYPVGDIVYEAQTLEHIDQAAEFDRTT